MAAPLDTTDLAILSRRADLLNIKHGPRVGDYIRFACGKERRIAHDHEDWGGGLQTAHDTIGHPGSFYLAEGHCSYSGALHDSVSHASLTATDEELLGRVWFFHHNQHRAHNGVETAIPFRLFICSLEAPS